MGKNIIAYYTNPVPESGLFDVGVRAIHKYDGENTYEGFSVGYYDDLEQKIYYLQDDESWLPSGGYDLVKKITGDVESSGSLYLSEIRNTAEYIRINYWDSAEESTLEDEYIQRSEFFYGYTGQSGVLNFASNKNGYVTFNSFNNQ